MTSILIDNKKYVGGLITTPGANMAAYYAKEKTDVFAINGSLNGTDSKFDWVSIRTHDSKNIKCGVTKISDNRDTLQISFQNPFMNNNYFLFFSSNNDVILKWTDKKASKFTIQGSGNIGSEISWLAIHKNFAITTGIVNSSTIFCGNRILSNSNLNTIDINTPADANGASWSSSEYIINPLTITPDNFYFNMNLNSYSFICSSNANINIYWKEKKETKIKIGTSFPLTGIIIDYLFIKSGVNWWEEF